jgi:hypothetical protein
VFSTETTHTNFIVFGLTQSVLEHRFTALKVSPLTITFEITMIGQYKCCISIAGVKDLLVLFQWFYSLFKRSQTTFCVLEILKLTKCSKRTTFVVEKRQPNKRIEFKDTLVFPVFQNVVPANVLHYIRSFYENNVGNWISRPVYNSQIKHGWIVYILIY